MRTTLTIDDDVLAVARALATRTGKSPGDAVSELARRGFGPPLEIDEKNGIPHFRVPEGTPPIHRRGCEEGAERLTTILIPV